MLGKGIVTRVVGRYGHDGTSTITCQYVFCYPDRDLLVVERIDGIASGEHTCHLMIHLTVTLRTLLYVVEILGYLFLLFRCGEFRHQL